MTAQCNLKNYVSSKPSVSPPTSPPTFPVSQDHIEAPYYPANSGPLPFPKCSDTYMYGLMPVLEIWKSTGLASPRIHDLLAKTYPTSSNQKNYFLLLIIKPDVCNVSYLVSGMYVYLIHQIFSSPGPGFR